MIRLRKDPSPQTNVPASPAHFLFPAGTRAPHCASQGPWDFSCNRVSQRAAEWLTLLRVVCIKLRLGVHFDSHILMIALLLGGFCRALSSPPDLTPFTLDKHNIKEKLRFYVRRVGYYTQGNRPIPPGVQPLVNHQAMKVSSPNRGLKQTEQGAPRHNLIPIPHWLLPFTNRNFYEEIGDAAKWGCIRAKRHRLRHPSLAVNQS